MREGLDSIRLRVLSVIPPRFVERLFLPIEPSRHTHGNQLATSARVYFWTWNPIPLICMSILMLVPNCLVYCVALKQILKSHSSFSRLSLNFQMNFRISLSASAKQPAGILMGMGFHFLLSPSWALLYLPNLGSLRQCGIFPINSVFCLTYKLGFVSCNQKNPNWIE